MRHLNLGEITEVINHRTCQGLSNHLSEVYVTCAHWVVAQRYGFHTWVCIGCNSWSEEWERLQKERKTDFLSIIKEMKCFQNSTAVADKKIWLSLNLYESTHVAFFIQLWRPTVWNVVNSKKSGHCLFFYSSWQQSSRSVQCQSFPLIPANCTTRIHFSLICVFPALSTRQCFMNCSEDATFCSW